MPISYAARGMIPKSYPAMAGAVHASTQASPHRPFFWVYGWVAPNRSLLALICSAGAMSLAF